MTNFVNMASGRNTKIGCAAKMSGNRADVYCLYDLFAYAGRKPYLRSRKWMQDRQRLHNIQKLHLHTIRTMPWRSRTWL
ncbi:hypothetical protein ANCCAN_24287 [Ancylostoma caninum]|uniref:Uncharacterized protein n=1 Tax=Ancylostoma caninum TaxID=29170 RepID=A0A368FCV0_ANCCA|nr:hypothetical protein ANCCAN_24287 [Ancylostoma caninum]